MMGVKILKIISLERLEQGTFRAEAIFPSENSYEVQIRDPFLEPGEIETDREQRLRWYFEEMLQIKEWDAPAAIEHLEIKEETKKVLQSLLEHVEKEK